MAWLPCLLGSLAVSTAAAFRLGPSSFCLFPSQIKTASGETRKPNQNKKLIFECPPDSAAAAGSHFFWRGMDQSAPATRLVFERGFGWDCSLVFALLPCWGLIPFLARALKGLFGVHWFRLACPPQSRRIVGSFRDDWRLWSYLWDLKWMTFKYRSCFCSHVCNFGSSGLVLWWYAWLQWVALSSLSCWIDGLDSLELSVLLFNSVLCTKLALEIIMFNSE